MGDTATLDTHDRLRMAIGLCRMPAHRSAAPAARRVAIQNPAPPASADLDSPALVERALGRERMAMSILVERLMPVVQARVARSIRRCRTSESRNPREVLADLVQDVFALLLEDDGRILARWDPARGLSLENFVGLVAERHARSILTTRKRSPWSESPDADIDTLMPPTRGAEARVVSADLLRTALDAVQAELTPKGLALFEALILEQRDAGPVATELGLSRGAVYQWRKRLLTRVRQKVHELEKTPVPPGDRVVRETR